MARRVAGEPLEHLLGWAAFHGLRVRVAPGVFVPRRRTELLVDLALGVVAPGEAAGDPAGSRPARRGPPEGAGVVVDLCCGSGAVGAAIAHAAPDTEVYAADLDPAAVACARENLPPERVFGGDLFDAVPHHLRGRVDVVVVNAPYVPSRAIATMPPEARDHEAPMALDGGPDGVVVHRRVAAAAGEWLAAGGALVLETSRDLAELSAGACADAGLATRVVVDAERDGTAVVATAP